MGDVTYERLFAFLEGLGFVETSPSNFKRVFEHAGEGVLLAFSMLDDRQIDRPVRQADLTSVEFQLQHRGLLAGELSEAMQRLGKS